MIERFTGTCDVCGAEIALEHDDKDGIVDLGIENLDESTYRAYTWIRHVDGLQEGCDIYASRVYSEPRKYLEVGSHE